MDPQFREKNLLNWEKLLLVMFNGNIHDYYHWDDSNDIINVLNFIGKDKNLNHTFFPTGGGLDLIGAGNSIEHGCIELYFHEKAADIIRPKILSFHSFGSPYEWSYFRLDTYELKPSGVYEASDRQSEELTEISPGQYIDRYYWDIGSYGRDESGVPAALPECARVITRFFSGSFVIFAKGSIYNAISGTYDARHSKMTSDEFRQYIKSFVESIKNNSKE